MPFLFSCWSRVRLLVQLIWANLLNDTDTDMFVGICDVTTESKWHGVYTLQLVVQAVVQPAAKCRAYTHSDSHFTSVAVVVFDVHTLRAVSALPIQCLLRLRFPNLSESAFPLSRSDLHILRLRRLCNSKSAIHIYSHIIFASFVINHQWFENDKASANLCSVHNRPTPYT